MNDNHDLHERVENDLTNHPINNKAVHDIEALREEAKSFAHTVVDICPTSREASLALTHIETGLMYAVAAVARNQS